MLEALGDALTAIAHDRTVRAVMLAANGPAFSAGHDLKELNARRSDDDRGRAYFKHIMGLCSGVMQQIVTLPQPVIAAVQAHRDRCRLPARGQLRSRRRLAAPRNSRRPASISACSARRPWWRCRATSRASTRWKCCSPAT